MKHIKRFAALVLALTVLSGCGNKTDVDPSSGSGSGSGGGASSFTPDLSHLDPMDLSKVTDPYLATAGIAGDTAVAQVAGENITAGELLYWLNYNARNYLYQFGGYITEIPWDTKLEDGTTLGEQLKEGALEAAAYYHLLHLVGTQEGFTPATEEIVSGIDKEFQELAAQVNNEDVVHHVLWAQSLTRDLLIYLNECSDLYSQLQELYYGENSTEYPTDADVMAWLDEGGYFRVKHILLMTVDQATRAPLDEAAIAQKKATADDLLAQLRAADDPIALFDTLMKEHSEDGGLATNPDGYIFNAQDSLVGGFREATLALDVGNISDVVETDYGYHIMLRLPIDPADYRSEVVSTRMQERSDTWTQEHPTEKLSAYDQIDPASFWEKLGTLQSAVYAEMEAAEDSGDSSGSQG